MNFKLCVANLVALFWMVVPTAMGANIIPQPSYIQKKQGAFDLAHNNNILYAGKHPEVNQIIDNFMEHPRISSILFSKLSPTQVLTYL